MEDITLGKEKNNDKQPEKEIGSDVQSIIEQLMGIESSFADFIAAESEGMIICENCYDNVFDDDENVCHFEDENGEIHDFCCKECMEEWKYRS